MENGTLEGQREEAMKITEKCDFCEADATNMIGEAFGIHKRLLFVCAAHLKATMKQPQKLSDIEGEKPPEVE